MIAALRSFFRMRKAERDYRMDRYLPARIPYGSYRAWYEAMGTDEPYETWLQRHVIHVSHNGAMSCHADRYLDDPKVRAEIRQMAEASA